MHNLVCRWIFRCVLPPPLHALLCWSLVAQPAFPRRFLLVVATVIQCNGHRGSDIFPYDIMTDVMTPQFTFYGKKAPNTMKNRMLIKLFDPSENALPFIYDNFEWSHCSEMVRIVLPLVFRCYWCCTRWSRMEVRDEGRAVASNA